MEVGSKKSLQTPYYIAVAYQAINTLFSSSAHAQIFNELRMHP